MPKVMTASHPRLAYATLSMGLPGKIFFFFVILFAALLIGLLAGVGGKLPVILGAGIIGAGFMVAWPRGSLWFVVLGALVFSGLIDLYAPSFGQLRWMIAGISIALIFVALTVRTGERGDVLTSRTRRPSVMFWAGAFFFSTVASSVFQGGLSFGWVVGMKGYFQVWGIMLSLAWFSFGRDDAVRFVKLLPWLAAIQLPFVLHQFFFIVPERSGVLDAARGIVAVDIVAGTFGGSAEGGGRSTLLALAQVIAITYVVAKWRSGGVRLLTMLASVVLFIAPLLFSEVKILFVILPFALALLFRDKLISNPVWSVIGAALMVAFLAAMLTIYSNLPGARSQKSVSVEDFVEQSISYNFGDRGYGNSILNRTTVYSFWFKENVVRGSFADALFGHGPGASSNSSSLARENIANVRYAGYAIGLTAVSALLWDFGVFGTIAALGFVLSAYFASRRFSKQLVGKPGWAEAKACQIGIALIGLTLLHSNYFVFDMAYQALFMILVGYVVVRQRHGVESSNC